MAPFPPFLSVHHGILTSDALCALVTPFDLDLEPEFALHIAAREGAKR
jgi:hypothetical protein